MNELLDYYWSKIKLLFIPYLLLLFLLAFPINYYVLTPGGLSVVENLITVDYNQDKDVEGTISSTYIMSVNRPTFFEFIIGYFNQYSTISILQGSNLSYSNEEITQISYLDKATSVDASIIVAYNEMSLINSDIHISYNEAILVYGKSTYLSNYDTIAFGDEFIQMIGDDGVIVTTISDIAVHTQAGVTYTFTFKNVDDETYLVDLTKDETSGLFGISLKTYYLVDKEDTFPNYTEASSNIGGPSGGLLQTLAIYNMLSDTDITHGLKIAGTGTINYDGSVGYIGGVKQKIATAYLNHVDIFFMPYLDQSYYYDNYVEALRACDELGIDPEGWLVPVATFSDALEYLNNLGGALS
jgi:PDZ domain-containing protein